MFYILRSHLLDLRSILSIVFWTASFCLLLAQVGKQCCSLLGDVNPSTHKIWLTVRSGLGTSLKIFFFLRLSLNCVVCKQNRSEQWTVHVVGKQARSEQYCLIGDRLGTVSSPSRPDSNIVASQQNRPEQSRLIAGLVWTRTWVLLRRIARRTSGGWRRLANSLQTQEGGNQLSTFVCPRVKWQSR